MPAPKRQPAFQFYPTAWLGSVQVEIMPAEVEGTYIRLLCRQWIANELPVEPSRLRLLTKLSPTQWKKTWPLLEPLFPVTEAGTGRRNPTLAGVQNDREAFAEQAAESGQRGAQKRWGKHTEPDAQPTQKKKGTGRKGDWVPVGYPIPDPTETPHQPQWGTGSSVSVSGTEPPSPSPGGEGASPAAPPPLAVVADAPGNSEAVLPGESLAEYRQRVRSSATTATGEAFASIEHAAGRAAIRRFVDEQRLLVDRIPNWVRRIEGWTNGLGTSGMRPVSWEAVVQGIEELLDSNPPGQTITPAQLLTFVERAERTRKAVEGPFAVPGTSTPKTASVSAADFERHTLITCARDGDEDAIAECTRRGIDYTRAIA